jgi:ribulose-5-phosphate 4-epimerase/fuculose-1-phosphate aldolase
MSPEEITRVRAQVSAEEWQARVELAALYRLTAMFKWDDLIFTHISLRVPGPEQHFLINPYGLLFDEITASSLVKVDLVGQLVMQTPYFINPAGYLIHSAIHEARPDAKCVFHTHTLTGVAVSAQKHGLLSIQQGVLGVSSLGYHNYEGLALDEAEKPILVANLGRNNSLILRNHGLLTVGRNTAEAFLAMYYLERACQVQVLAQSGGVELLPLTAEVLQRIPAQAAKAGAAVPVSQPELVWAALLRKLDRLDPSYKS